MHGIWGSPGNIPIMRHFHLAQRLPPGQQAPRGELWPPCSSVGPRAEPRTPYVLRYIAKHTDEGDRIHSRCRHGGDEDPAQAPGPPHLSARLLPEGSRL